MTGATEKTETNQDTPHDGVRLILPLPGTLNHHWRSVNGRVLLSKDSRNYRRTVGWILRDQHVRLYPGDIGLELRFPRTSDIDAPLKALLDSFRGILYMDDSAVARLTVEFFAADGNPRCEVFAYPMANTPAHIRAPRRLKFQTSPNLRGHH